ncbi:MAG: alpha-2-macroglobulin family protein [Alphaproteobacteria bacterium]|nr:alpha-2-macroglobulin family protein [Alphaproteobacteria bacterium]
MLKKTKKFPVRTLRIVGIVIAAIVFFALAYSWISGTNKNITKLDVFVSAPVAAHFDDDKATIISDNIPDINNNRNLAPASKLRIQYDVASGPYNPAFNMDTSASELAQNIKITPAVRGHWNMINPYDITFTPDQDWPAATNFTVKIGEKLFADDVHPDTRKISFKTAPISAKTEIFNAYPIPGGDRYVIGVAVISFNYPIQTRDFADKVLVRLDGRKIDFNVKFDRYMRTAIIQTAPIQITDETQTLRLKVNQIFDADGNSHTDKITAKIILDSADNFFKISDLNTITADNKQGNPQQLILLNMTAAARDNTNWNNFVDVYLLPRNAKTDEDTTESHRWANDEITQDIIKESKKLNTERVDFVNPIGTYQYAFAYDVPDNVERYIYVTIKPSIKSANGFETRAGISTVMTVAYPERSVKIAGSGALLSLAGDRQLGIVARGGVDTAYVNLYKIESNSINHLITQTYNLFSDLEFRAPWVFDAYDMSTVFQKRIPFSDTSMTNVNYASVNLGEYLDRTYNDKTGIFIVKVGATEISAEYNDARLIMLTDLGIIRKINLDKTSVVFVSKISTGAPATDTDVTVLGRNGYPIWAGTTNASGMVEIPSFSYSEYKNEKEPVAIIARQGSDVSFIPYNADRAQTAEYSKFDVGGTYASSQAPLKSFIFSDRGIYRPGETLTIGAIIKNSNFTSVAGIPIELEVNDARGHTIFERKISLSADGMIDATYKLSTDATIGQYDITIHSLNNRGHVQDNIGNGHFMVQEFVPDTMKIMATIDNSNENGWIAPDAITTNVSLHNLYGTPASDRRIRVNATLRPIDFTFSEYSDYKFTGNFASDDAISNGFARTAQTFSTTVDDIRTDENGNANINVDFNREIPIGTYMLNLNIDGFEAGDGKSVQTNINSRVSGFEYLVGYHSNSDLGYIKRNTDHKIKLIALDNSGKPVTVDNIETKLIRRDNLTSLIKDYNNQYKYQTVTHDTVINQTKISISESGTEFELNTKDGGTYYLEIFDSNNNVLANIEYFVASNENIDMQTNTNADLKIKLDASEYKPGDTINIGITAPYTGTGIITIERDKVYAHKWFSTKTTTSTQQITLPRDFEGTGYVNVSFVRDINSRDVFTTPYTYAIAPFATNLDNHRINVKLSAPEKVTDNKLKIEYSTDTDARLMLFAVNTGILQVANYVIPNPIKHFFQKAALQVETSQILSLLLPEYKILREVAKTGGGDFESAIAGLDMPLTNPFARKSIPSVAFYSGILETKANETKSITFDIPEYFNGALSVYAVATDTDRIGSTSTNSRVQSPVIISVSNPAFVAPGDKFTVNTIISNLTPESGATATARNDASVSGPIGTMTNDADTIDLPENTEKLWSFDVMAKSTPGVGDINVSTTLFNDKGIPVASRRTSTSLSIRPAATFTSLIKTGVLNKSSITIKPDANNLYAENSGRTLYISTSPSILVRPLAKYLEKYEYDCTEQIVSRTIPYLLIGDDKLVGNDPKKSSESVERTIRTLTNRQNSDGSFGMWTSGMSSTETTTNATTIYITSYVANFLSIAQQSGFTVPHSMFVRSIDFLRRVAAETPTSEFDAKARAFAIYVLTLNDYVTTSYIDSLQEYVSKEIPDWQHGLIGAYIAASYKMLKQNDKAYNIITKYRTNNTKNDIFDNMVANDATYEFIARKYFDMSPKTILPGIQDYINNGSYDSFTAAAIVMDLAGSGNNAENIQNISVFADNQKLDSTQSDDFITSVIPYGTKKIRIDCPECKSNNAMFYTFIASGFPKSVESASNGIEISRHYYDINGDEVKSATIGDMIDVKITVRTKDTTNYVSNAVISDLLPGGFAPVSDSITGDTEFSEIREDRVLLYTDISRTPKTFTYRAQLTSSGEFTVPPITANDMYNSGINAVGNTGKFTVSNAAH